MTDVSCVCAMWVAMQCDAMEGLKEGLKKDCSLTWVLTCALPYLLDWRGEVFTVLCTAHEVIYCPWTKS